MINCQNKNCCACPNFVSTTAITQVGNTLILSIPPTVNITNNEKLCIAFAQNVPNIIGIPNIAIYNGVTVFPVLEQQTKGVHLMYADQLKQCNCGIANRQILSVIYSADLGMFTYAGCRRLPKTNAIAEINCLSAITSLSAKDENPVEKGE